MLSPIQWGTIILHLDNETFRKAFSSGRSRYFDNCEYEAPHVAHRMNTLMHQVVCLMRTAKAATVLIVWPCLLPLTSWASF